MSKTRTRMRRCALLCRVKTRLQARVVVLLASCGLLLSGCSDTDDVDRAKPVVTAGAKTGDLFLHGVIERNGKPVEGATFDVLLEPVEEMRNAEVGDVIRQFTASSATSDSDGSFALRLKADDLPSKYFESGRRFLNFSLNVVAGKEFAHWGSTLYPVGSPAVWRTTDEAVPADSAMKLELDIGKERHRVTDSFDQTEKGGLAVMRPPGS